MSSTAEERRQRKESMTLKTDDKNYLFSTTKGNKLRKTSKTEQNFRDLWL